MMINDEIYLADIPAEAEIRLEKLKSLFYGLESKPERTGFTNCHIHTSYSFSPYSPSAAVWNAYTSGLATAGIMDHDSISGAREFILAGRIVGLPVTIGVECRVRTDGTPLFGRRINNPDQFSVAYVALHGIPHSMIDRVDGFFAPYRALRGERNRKMCSRIDGIVSRFGLSLDYEKDVLPISMHSFGGSVTERHLLFALVKKIAARYGSPEKVVGFLSDSLGIMMQEKVKDQIISGSPDSPFYLYDIMGALKSGFVSEFYVDAAEECPHISEITKLADEIGAVSAYAYLGDVGNSVTGDKKPQKFEDDYLPLLMDTIKTLGFRAVTYMPSHNTPQQLDRIMKLCREYGFFEISGEDINSPRQSFICKALSKPECAHLAPSAFALISHELVSTEDLSLGMFGEKAISDYPDITDRVKHFSEMRF